MILLKTPVSSLTLPTSELLGTLSRPLTCQFCCFILSTRLWCSYFSSYRYPQWDWRHSVRPVRTGTLFKSSKSSTAFKICLWEDGKILKYVPGSDGKQNPPISYFTVSGLIHIYYCQWQCYLDWYLSVEGLLLLYRMSAACLILTIQCLKLPRPSGHNQNSPQHHQSSLKEKMINIKPNARHTAEMSWACFLLCH